MDSEIDMAKALIALIAVTLVVASACSDELVQPPSQGISITPGVPPAPTLTSPVASTPLSFPPGSTFRGDALGLEFGYPSRLDSPQFSACRPASQPGGSSVSLGPNVTIRVDSLTSPGLASYADAFLNRIGAQSQSTTSSADRLRVEYRLMPAGRFGIATFVIRGSRAYTVVFEARNAGACGEVTPTEIYEQALSTLHFLN